MLAVTEELRDRTLTLRFDGDATGAAALEVNGALRAARERDVSRVNVELSERTGVDSATAVAALIAAQALARDGVEVRLGALTARQEATFRMIPAPEAEPAPAPAGRGFIEQVGRGTAGTGRSAGAFIALGARTLRAVGRAVTGFAPLRVGAVVEQVGRLGYGALGLVCLLSATLGMVLSLQSVAQLRRYGAELFVADLVGIGMIREFAPILTAIILAGRSSTGIAAEIGTMRVREEIDALQTMGVDPTELLVLPRILALLIAQPILTVFSMTAGILGAMIHAASLGISRSLFLERLEAAVMLDDVVTGLLKSFLFAGIVVFSGVFMGLRTRGGGAAVGQSATSAVVAAITLIVLVDSAASFAVLGLQGR